MLIDKDNYTEIKLSNRNNRGLKTLDAEGK